MRYWLITNTRARPCRSSDEVLHILGNILAALQRGRTSLVTPKKKPIDELMKSRNMVRTRRLRFGDLQ